MKKFRFTFETTKLDVYNMCELVKLATLSNCNIRFSEMDILMHIETDNFMVKDRLMYFKELCGA